MISLILAPTFLPLVERLAERLAGPLPSVFHTEHVVVPARATGDWLAAELADRLGVWSGHAVYTPARLLERLGGGDASGPAVDGMRRPAHPERDAIGSQ